MLDTIELPPLEPICDECQMRHPVCAVCALPIALTEHNIPTCECPRLPL